MSVNLYNATTDTLKNVAGDIINPQSINNMIAPIEDGTASKAYAVGEQFIMNDLLCEATQAIAQGDTMVIGTNCEESEQLSKQIKDINNDLTASDNLKFKFMTDGDGNYGYRGADDSFVPFKSGGAKLVGTYSSDTTINVSAYGAKSANEFLLVPSQNASGSYNGWVGDVTSPHSSTTYTNFSLSLNGNTLRLSVPKVTTQVRGGHSGMWAGDINFNVPCNLYYVGDIS